MNISERRNLDNNYYNILKALKYKNNIIEVMGTAGLKSQRFFSDVDLYSRIQTRETKKNIYDEIKNIINKTSEIKDLYFIELKVQSKNNEKIKINNVNDINYDSIKKLLNNNLDIIKLDYITRMNGKFIELSIIYDFKKEPLNINKLIESIKKDIHDLKKEGNYYKALKREFSILNIKNVRNLLTIDDLKRMFKLSNFFNSQIGKLYQDTSNLKTIELLLKYYNDDIIKKKVITNLKDLKINPDINKINEYIKKNDQLINKKSLKYF